MTRDELVATLRSWHDFFPFPATWTGELQRRSTAAGRGPAPFRRVECSRCEGSGKLGVWDCPDCEGRGSFWIDGYTHERVETREASWEELLSGTVNCSRCGGWGRLGAHAETRPEKTARLCLDCDGTGKVPAPLSPRGTEPDLRPRQGDRALDALSDQHQRRDHLHAYQRLARALDELHKHAPGIGFLIGWVYILEVQKPSAANEAHVEIGLCYLEGRLVDVKAPSWITHQVERHKAALVLAKGRGADTKAQGLRDEEIRRRRANGETVTGLAAAFNLDKGQVSRIVNKR